MHSGVYVWSNRDEKFEYPKPDAIMTGLIYPRTKTIEQIDDYHGTLVSDPYRWLEDVDSADTQEWIAAQNELTFSYLGTIPQRDQIRNRLSELWDYPRFSAPFRRGERYFQFRNTGLQNQDVLFVMDSPDGPGRVLIDPNQLSTDGTVALTAWSVSQDGTLLAYATSGSGSDWQIWHVRRVDSGEDLPDTIEWGKWANAAWLPDGSGFYYACYDAPAEGLTYTGANYFHKVYLHRLGEHQSQDQLVYERSDQKEWGYSPEVSDDGRYLILTIWQGTDTRNRLFFRDLQTDSTFIELIDTLEAGFIYIGNEGSVFYLRTDLDSPRGKLIAVDVNNPQRKNWQTVIPESDDVLSVVRMSQNHFITLYMHNAYHQIKCFDFGGSLQREIKLPSLGAIPTIGDDYALYTGRQDNELFYTFQSFSHPPTVYRYDLPSGSSKIIAAPQIDFDFTPYQTKQVFATAKDGTRIPLFLVYRNNLDRNGTNPTLLYGYGGFNIPMTPVFSISRLVWLEMGGVLAVACLRGGGEYGEDWHKAGMLHEKQNVFDDFIACAEYLIDQGFTSSKKLAIQGGSNGGLLVGACMTQRPELFEAALPAVGVMDMLRFHRFTIGWAWVSDYGSSDDPAGFRTLYAYSPLHNIQPGKQYPATLITTADHDDRVVPGHSFKFAASLQASHGGDAPVLIRIQTKAGHGFGKPTSLLIAEQADIWAFLAVTLGMDTG